MSHLFSVVPLPQIAQIGTLSWLMTETPIYLYVHKNELYVVHRCGRKISTFDHYHNVWTSGSDIALRFKDDDTVIGVNHITNITFDYDTDQNLLWGCTADREIFCCDPVTGISGTKVIDLDLQDTMWTHRLEHRHILSVGPRYVDLFVCLTEWSFNKGCPYEHRRYNRITGRITRHTLEENIQWIKVFRMDDELIAFLRIYDTSNAKGYNKTYSYDGTVEEWNVRLIPDSPLNDSIMGSAVAMLPDSESIIIARCIHAGDFENEFSNAIYVYNIKSCVFRRSKAKTPVFNQKQHWTYSTQCAAVSRYKYKEELLTHGFFRETFSKHIPRYLIDLTACWVERLVFHILSFMDHWGIDVDLILDYY